MIMYRIPKTEVIPRRSVKSAIPVTAGERKANRTVGTMTFVLVTSGSRPISIDCKHLKLIIVLIFTKLGKRDIFGYHMVITMLPVNFPVIP